MHVDRVSVDAGIAQTTAMGVAGAAVASANMTAAASVTDAPSPGSASLVVTDVWISTDTAMRVDLLEETTGTLLWSAYLPANAAVQFTPRGKLKLPTAGKRLQAQASTAGNLRVLAIYYSE